MFANQQSLVHQMPHSALDQRTYLDAGIVHGLFEAVGGNRFLAVRNNGRRRVVALQHNTLPKYAVVKRSEQMREYGRWWGTCYLRRISEAKKAERSALGILEVRDDGAYLNYLAQSGNVRSIQIGVVPDTDFAGFYSHWAIEAVNVFYHFFERTSSGQTAWGPEGHNFKPEESVYFLETAFGPKCELI